MKRSYCHIWCTWMPYLLCESSHEVGWVLWSIFILPWSRAGLCFSLYLDRECVRIYQRRRARSTLKNGFAWFRPNRTSWSGFFVPGTIFGSIRFIWAKNQPSRPFHSKDTCPFGPYVLPFPILFYSIRDSIVCWWAAMHLLNHRKLHSCFQIVDIIS